MATTSSSRVRANGSAGRGMPRECPRCGLHDCETCQARDERDDELGDVVEDMAAELGEIRAGQVELVTLLRELVTLARGSRFRRVPASEVAAAVAQVEPEDDEPERDDHRDDDHQDDEPEGDDEPDREHLVALRTGTGPVHVADPEHAPGRDVPSVLLSDLRAVEAARAPAPAGGDAFDQLTEQVLLALDARWASRDALQHVLRAASRVQRQSPADDARGLLAATLPQLAPGGPAQAAARAMLNAAE